MIGDVALARRLQAKYRDLRFARDPWDAYAGPVVEQEIARILAELLDAEARLAAENLYLTADGELARIPQEDAA